MSSKYIIAWLPVSWYKLGVSEKNGRLIWLVEIKIVNISTFRSGKYQFNDLKLMASFCVKKFWLLFKVFNWLLIAVKQIAFASLLDNRYEMKRGSDNTCFKTSL